MHKTTMWCVGNCKIPHARQDTDVAMESFHNNMKQIFMSFREWFTRCRLDWLIFHLVGNVFTHYWYDVQCKLFRYVRRKKKGIVASTVLRVRDILDSNVCQVLMGRTLHMLHPSTTHPKYGPFTLCHLNGHNAIELPTCKMGDCMQTCHEGIQNVILTFLMVPLLRIWAHSME